MNCEGDGKVQTVTCVQTMTFDRQNLESLALSSRLLKDHVHQPGMNSRVPGYTGFIPSAKAEDGMLLQGKLEFWFPGIQLMLINRSNAWQSCHSGEDSEPFNMWHDVNTVERSWPLTILHHDILVSPGHLWTNAGCSGCWCQSRAVNSSTARLSRGKESRWLMDYFHSVVLTPKLSISKWTVHAERSSSKVANGPASGSVAGITYCFVRALTFQGEVELAGLEKRLFRGAFQVGVKTHDMPSFFDGLSFERSFGQFEVDNSTSSTCCHQILGRMVQLKKDNKW